MPDPSDTAAGDYGQGTSSSNGLGGNTGGGSNYGGGGGADSGANGAGGMGSYNGGGSSAGSGTGGGSDSGGGNYGSTGNFGGNNNYGGQNVASGNYGGSNSSGGSVSSAASTSSASSASNSNSSQKSGGVSGIASSGKSSFQGPGVNSLNAPVTSSGTYSSYNTPTTTNTSSGGIASLGNRDTSAFGNFQGPGVNGLNSPVRTNTSSSAPNGTYGPRADSPQYANSPTAGAGSYVDTPKMINDRVGTYNDLGIAGVPGAAAQRYQTGVPGDLQRNGLTNSIPADSGPFAGGYGGFEADRQQYAVDRGLLGSQSMAPGNLMGAAPSTVTASYNPLSSVSPPVNQSVSTVGANSPFADQAVSSYNPVQSFQNYVVPAAQALAGTPAGMNFTPNYPGTNAYAAGMDNSTIPAPTRIVGDQNMRQPAPTNIVSTSGLADPNITGPSYMGPGTTSRWASLENYGQIQPVNTPYDKFSPTNETVVAKNDQGVSYDPLSSVSPPSPPTNQVAAVEPTYTPGMVHIKNPFSPSFTARNIIPSLANQAIRKGYELNQSGDPTVADNEQYVDPGVPDNGQITLPDPTEPTDRYVPDTSPGQEDNSYPGTNPTDWASRGGNDFTVIPTSDTSSDNTEDTAGNEETDPDKDGLGWMKYYPKKYSTQSSVVKLPKLTPLRNPVSTGVGSLFPRISVTPYRG